MADQITVTDKLPVGDFTRLVVDGLMDAFATIETKYPQWQVGNTELTLRGVLKPGTLGGKAVVFLDVDEPVGEPVTEIVVPLVRRPQ